MTSVSYTPVMVDMANHTDGKLTQVPRHTPTLLNTQTLLLSPNFNFIFNDTSF